MYVQVHFTDGSARRYNDVKSAQTDIRKRVNSAQEICCSPHRPPLGVEKVTNSKGERLDLQWSVRLLN